MSIRAMTWAFALPLEPRAKIALLAIADNARDDGVAWPSRDTIAEKSSQSRATVSRRMKMLAELGVLAIHQRFREDGTQTTDEIRLNLAVTADDVLRRTQSLRGETAADDHDDDGIDAGDPPDDSDAEGGGCQADTLGSHPGNPGVAVVTRGGLHSCNPHNEPSLEPESPPNPPPGGCGPLTKAEKDASEKRQQLWQRFLAAYPGIAAMDQQAAQAEFDHLPVDDAEWAASVCPAYDTECRKLRKPPKNAHLWLRKRMFTNFPRAKIEPPSPERPWIAEGDPADRALRLVRHLARQPQPFVHTRSDGSRGYHHRTDVGADLLAMLEFESGVPLRWPKVARGSDHFAAWQQRFRDWIGQGLPVDPADDSIHVPTLWPPKKDGTIYRDDIAITGGEDLR